MSLEDLHEYRAWVYLFYSFYIEHYSKYLLLCFADETQPEAVNKWWQNFYFWVYCLFNYCIELMLSLNIPPAGPWQRDWQMPGSRDSHWIKQVQPTKHPPPPPNMHKKTLSHTNAPSTLCQSLSGNRHNVNNGSFNVKVTSCSLVLDVFFLFYTLAWTCVYKYKPLLCQAYCCLGS